MNTRNLDDYYAVWTDGHEWPELFADLQMAKDRARHLSRDKLGHTVHVCRFQSVGTISIPHNLNLDGVMLGGETSAPATAS